MTFASPFDRKPTATMGDEEVPFVVALLAGACAGTSVDLALFPLDTIKTRLQSPQGFFKAGGFSGIYNGISAVGAVYRPARSARRFLGTRFRRMWLPGLSI